MLPQVLYLSTLYKPHELQQRCVMIFSGRVFSHTEDDRAGWAFSMPRLPFPVPLEVCDAMPLPLGCLSSGLSSGLLATVITKMDGVGGLSGWRWIFILEGIATVLIAFIAWLMMPADLSSAKFFTEEERAFARESTDDG